MSILKKALRLLFAPLFWGGAWLKRMHPFKAFIVLCFSGGAFGALLVSGILIYFSFQVPNLQSLEDYDPKQVTKIYDKDGEIIAEYAVQRRFYVPISQIPKPVVDAFLAAEDSSFFQHGGFDPKGILRAIVVNVFTDRKQGASTITQQVAKTFLLTNERTYTRKIKEFILARRIERSFSKNEILELYLNQIYLGAGSYGVGAAAYVYYGKSLEELNVQQRAMIAGLPKAPSAYNPLRYPERATWRRNLVINRMLDEGFITSSEAEEALDSGLELDYQPMVDGNEAPYFVEHVRRFVVDKYGSEELYEGGLSVFTTLDKEKQQHAEKAIRDGLRDYDRRHGWRGAYTTLMPDDFLDWQVKIDEIYKAHLNLEKFAIPAVVIKIDDANEKVIIGLPGGKQGTIPLAAMLWAKKYITADDLGPAITKPSDVVGTGDVVFVQKINKVSGYKRFAEQADYYSLEQIPAVQGALVSLDNNTGAVRAMVGGFAGQSEFNRAIQAKRQPGSAFKPIVYAAALENNYTAASVVLDAPVVVRGGEDTWKPRNYSQKVYGPSTLRRGLVLSRNLMTIRLARDLGIRNIINFAGLFGLETEDMAPNLSTALGSSATDLLTLTSAYSVFPNAGDLRKPYFIESIQNQRGQVIMSGPYKCENCLGEKAAANQAPILSSDAKQIMSAENAYIMTDMLRSVVTSGTGWRARAVGHPVGAKTGTTNDYVDAWFVGFSKQYSTGVWVGFDTPQTLGHPESGSKAASPIWTAYTKDALNNYLRQSFTIPDGVTFVRIDEKTGKSPNSETEKSILEVFAKGTEPVQNFIFDNSQTVEDSGAIESPSRIMPEIDQPQLLNQGIY